MWLELSRLELKRVEASRQVDNAHSSLLSNKTTAPAINPPVNSRGGAEGGGAGVEEGAAVEAAAQARLLVDQGTRQEEGRGEQEAAQRLGRVRVVPCLRVGKMQLIDRASERASERRMQ